LQYVEKGCWAFLGGPVAVRVLASGQWNVPEAVCGVAFADDDNMTILVALDVVLGEKGNTIVIAELTD
jgi:hypothetical protein